MGRVFKIRPIGRFCRDFHPKEIQISSRYHPEEIPKEFRYHTEGRQNEFRAVKTPIFIVGEKNFFIIKHETEWGGLIVTSLGVREDGNFLVIMLGLPMPLHQIDHALNL